MCLSLEKATELHAHAMAFETGRRKAAAILTVFRVRLSNEKIRTSTELWKSAQQKPMDECTIKTPNPKCRLYWCLIEFINKTSWGPSIYTIKITVRGVDLKPLVITK